MSMFSNTSIYGDMDDSTLVSLAQGECICAAGLAVCAQETGKKQDLEDAAGVNFGLAVDALAGKPEFATVNTTAVKMKARGGKLTRPRNQQWLHLKRLLNSLPSRDCRSLHLPERSSLPHSEAQ